MVIVVFWLAVYAGIVFVLILVLGKVGVTKRKVIFASFTLFGILSGLVATLNILGETALCSNPGVPWGEEIYNFSIKHIGDPSSALAHYTIPWALRTPQIFLFTSTVAWGLIGALAQIIYNRRKKPPITKGLSTRIIIISLLGCLAVCTGVVYAIHEAHAKPLEPIAFPVVEAGGPPISDWETITTYEVERLYLSHDTIFVGWELYVTGWVKNTGTERGIVKVELSLDGKVLSSQEVALLPGESKPVRFVVIVPKEGTYTVGIDSLTANFKVEKPPERVTEEESRQTATDYLMNSPTFKFDGIEGSITLMTFHALENKDTWEFIYKFECAHPGYGDRSGQILAQIITPHTARIVVRKGGVVSAVIDEKWDIMGAREFIRGINVGNRG